MNRILRSIVILLAVVAAAALILIYGFRLKTVTVEGNDRYSSDQISQDLRSSSLLSNTLFFAWRYRNATTSADAPYLTSIKAKILSPSSVKVTVTESRLVGRVQYNNQNVYFDENGIVLMITGEVREDVPLVTGVKMEKPVLYQKLTLDNASTLRTMLSITQLLIQEDFIPDSVTFDESGNMTVRFGGVAVRLGQDEYLEEKIANLVAIYPQISSESGTLNMEGFTGKNSSITFRRSSGETSEDETEGEVNPGQTLTGVGSDSTAVEQDGDNNQTAQEADGGEGAESTDDGSSPDQDGSAGEENTNQGDEENGNPDESSGSGVMAFDSNGTLHYDARIVNGQVVDSSGNPIAGCTVDENGNIKDAYWNVIDPDTGENITQ